MKAEFARGCRYRYLAYEGGELRAAVSLATGAAIADPFAPTARLVELLVTQAAPRQQGRRSRLTLPRMRRRAIAWRLETVER